DMDVITVGYQISTDSEFSEDATTSVVIPADQYDYYNSLETFNCRKPSTTYYYRTYVLIDGEYYYNDYSPHTTDALAVTGYNIIPATIKATTASALPSIDAWDLTDIDEMGVAYSTSADFLTTGTGISYTAMQEGLGGYMLALSGLTPATGYYYTYYIKRGTEYEYGPAESVLSFATLPDASCISVDEVKPQNATPGKVIFTGSSQVADLAKTTYSIVTSLEYATKEDFSDKTVKEFTGNLSFQKNDLKPATTYYYRIALAYNDGKNDKTLYTAVKSFTTNEIVVNINVVDALLEDVSATFMLTLDYFTWDISGLKIGVIVTSDSNCEPTSDGAIIQESFDDGMGLRSDVSDLAPATKYYYRSYVKRGDSYTKGEILSFTTKDYSPKVSSITVDSVTPMTNAAGKVIFTGTVNFAQKTIDNYEYQVAFEYATSSDFSTDYVSTPISGNKIEVTKTNLKPSKTYYYRAALTYNGSTDYTDTKQFNTDPLSLQVLADTYSTKDTDTELCLQIAAAGYSNWDLSESDFGVQYSTKADCSEGEYFKAVMSLSPFAFLPYECYLKGLTPGTTYYYRTYSKSGESYNYGTINSFKTTGEAPAGTTTVNISQADLFKFGTNTSASSPKTLTFSGVDLEVATSGGGTNAETYYILLNGSTPYIKIKAPKPITSVVLDKITCTSNNVGESTPCVVGIYSSIGNSPVMLDSYSISTKGESHKVEIPLDGTVDEVYVQASLKSQVTGISVTY
ncbi:MAG: hypothetical protein ACI4B4_14145, partial [Segatella copri]